MKAPLGDDSVYLRSVAYKTCNDKSRSEAKVQPRSKCEENETVAVIVGANPER